MIFQTTNNINDRQNEEEILTLLFSQKVLYEEVKKYKLNNFFISIAVFIVGIITSKVTEKEYLFIASSLLGFVLLILSVYINKKMKDSNILAASTQELIDRKIYGFDTGKRHLSGKSVEEIISKSRDIAEVYPEEYIININHTGNQTPNGVKNWYENITNDLEENRAILKCQSQNVYWDKALVSKYKSLILKGVSIFIVLCAIIYINKPLKELILLVIGTFPITRQILGEVVNIYKNIKYSEKVENISNVLNSSYDISIDQLKDLQSEIYMRRCSSLNVPTDVYNKLNNDLHYKYKRDN